MIAAGVVQAASPPPIEAEIAWVSRGEYCEPETVLPLPDDSVFQKAVTSKFSQARGSAARITDSHKDWDWR
jgi:hypothetical protein